jgi:hypothetical protein
MGCPCKYVNSYLHACLCELLLHFVLGELNSVECGVGQVVWSFCSWFLFTTVFFLVVVDLKLNLLNNHECICSLLKPTRVFDKIC